MLSRCKTCITKCVKLITGSCTCIAHRSQAYIKDHIEGYQAKADDLAYPAKLEEAAAKATTAAAASTAAVEAVDGEITEASNGDVHEPEEVRLGGRGCRP